MPIESSKAQLGGLDFGPYIQGKSFNRSVSISEVAPSASTTDCTAPSGEINPSPSSFPTVTRFASGGSGTSDISPSPFSSTTTTISPDIPLPESTPAFPTPFLLSSNQLSTSDPQNIYACETARSTTTTVTVVENNMSAGRQSTRISPVRLAIPELNILLRDTASHLTVNLLAQLLDPQLPPEWREALLSNFGSADRPASLNVASPARCETDVRGHSMPSSTTNTSDRVDLLPGRRPNPPTPSPTEETVLVKRAKSNDHKPLKEPVESIPSSSTPSRPPETASGHADSVKPGQITIPSSFVSPKLSQCACRLADNFEARYGEKLGNLLEDVARLSTTPNSVSESVSSVPGDEGETSVVGGTVASTQLSDTIKAEAGSESLSEGFIGTVEEQLTSARVRFHTVLNELFSERINWGRVIAMLAFVRALCVLVESPREVQSISPTFNPPIQKSKEECTLEQTPSNSQPPTQTGNIIRSSTSLPNDRTEPATRLPHADGDAKTTDRLSELYTMRHQTVESQCPVRAAHYVVWATEFIHRPEGIWQWIETHGGWEGLIKFERERGLGGALNEQLAAEMTEDEAMRLLSRSLLAVTVLTVGAVGLFGAVGLVAALRYLSKRF